MASAAFRTSLRIVRVHCPHRPLFVNPLIFGHPCPTKPHHIDKKLSIFDGRSGAKRRGRACPTLFRVRGPRADRRVRVAAATTPTLGTAQRFFGRANSPHSSLAHVCLRPSRGVLLVHLYSLFLLFFLSRRKSLPCGQRSWSLSGPVCTAAATDRNVHAVRDESSVNARRLGGSDRQRDGRTRW